MAIAVTCQACGRQYNVKDEAAGKKFKCKDCGEAVSVPEGAGAGAAGSGTADDYGDAYNPYADDDPGGGGVPPPVAARRPRKTSGGRSSATSRTAGPGISLMVCGTLSLLVSVGFGAVMLFGAAVQPPPDAPPEVQTIMIIYAIGIMVLGGGIASLIIVGGNSLRTCGSYGLAMAGSIVAVIPCLAPCICLPFGIWGLVVLSDAEVKAAFR